MAIDEISNKPEEPNMDHSNYCFPSIIMFCTSFEAYINENLELSKAIAITRNKEGLEPLVELIDSIKSEKEIKNKIKYFFKVYDKESIGLDLNSDIYQNLVALFQLRNEIIHYSPDMIPANEWPIRTREAFYRSNPRVREITGWTTTFGSVSVTRWAHDAIVTAIKKFAEISGCHDPFSDKTRKTLRWT
jgi:hypothetical protein